MFGNFNLPVSVRTVWPYIISMKAGGAANMATTVLFLVDLRNDFFSPKGAMSHDSFLTIDLSLQSDIEAAILASSYHGKRIMCGPGSSGAQLYPNFERLKYDDDAVFVKQYYSSFTNTGLAAYFRREPPPPSPSRE